jgi:serine/threonine-protein kinase
VPSFEIPDGPTTVALTTQSVKGKLTKVATVTFTVTNKTAQPLACRLKAAPQGDAQAEWFEVQGEKERPFAASETQKITVDIAAPGDLKPGDFKFRLQAMNVNDPGNDYAESAVATITVTAAPAKKPPIWPYILVAVALVLIVIVVAVLVLHKGNETNSTSNSAPTNQVSNSAPPPPTNTLTAVPDVSSSQSVSFESAFQTLTGAGFTVSPNVGATVSQTGPYDVVVSQYPLARTMQPPKTAVTLTMQVRPSCHPLILCLKQLEGTRYRPISQLITKQQP